MDGTLQGRVAIVTGAGRGVGRSHALRLAAEGAAVVVNDLGSDSRGVGKNATTADEVVADIVAAGGAAITSAHDVADWQEAADLVTLAIDTFGRLDVLVNNAGILRDRTIANMTEEEWDAVVRVHLKGHAAPTKHAVAYWRQEAKADREVKASVIHTSSVAGLFGNFGQAAYSSAKLAVLAFSRVLSLEANRYGVRSNVILPSARTRLGLGDAADNVLDPPKDPDAFDRFDPANVSPLVAWLAGADCIADSQVFYIYGNHLFLFSLPHLIDELHTEGIWTLAELQRQLPSRLVDPTPLDTVTELWVAENG